MAVNVCRYCKINSREDRRLRWYLIILGEDWVECCEICFEGDEGSFINIATGETLSFKQLYERLLAEEKLHEEITIELGKEPEGDHNGKPRIST